jgi:autotransporter-associated beta strand protein
MKPKFSLRHFLLCSVFACVTTVHGQSSTWITDGDANWNDTANWLNGTIATGSGNTANLTAELTGNRIITLGENRTIGNITFTDGTTSSNNLSIAGNTLTLAGTTPTINVTQSDRSLTISSAVTGTSGFTKTGSGMLALTSANSIGGNITISEGILRAGNGTTTANALNTRPVSIAAGAELQFDSPTVSGQAASIGALSGDGTVRFLASRRVNTSVAQTDSGNLAFVLESGGTLGITHGSSLAIHLGELSGSGIIQRAGATTTGAPTLHIGGKNTDSTFSGTITPSNVGSAMMVNKVGSGTLTLSGTNHYSGTNTVTNGTLVFARTGSLYNTGTASWTAANINVKSGATLGFNVGGPGEFSTTNVTTLLTNLAASSSATNGMNAGSTLGFNTTNAAGGTFTINDVIADTTGDFGGDRGLAKLGTGILQLTNTNTYSGSTTVHAGTLALDASGSIANSSTISVGTGATLDVSAVSGWTVGATQTVGGTGAIVGNTTIEGTLSPGQSPGTFAFDNNLSIATAAEYFFEGGDLTTVGGTLTLNDDWILSLGSGFMDGGAITLFTYDTAGSLDLTPSLDISGLGFTPSSSLTLTNTGSEIVLNGVSLIPEPTATLLGSLGLLALLRRRR